MKTSGVKLGASTAQLRQFIAQNAIALTSGEDGIEFLNRKNPASQLIVRSVKLICEQASNEESIVRENPE